MLGVAAVLVGVGLGALIVAVWWPCAGVQPPIDHLSTPRPCVEVTSGTNTAWIGLLLWPLGLALAGFAAVRAVARYGGAIAWAVAIVLALVVVLANPLAEYWLLNLRAQSWDEPPGTGALTALTFVLAGIVLLTTRERRMRGTPVREWA